MIRLLRPLTALAFAAATLAPQIARADDTIKHPGDHPVYAWELEPHLLFGWDNIFPGNSYGIGGRFSIPIVENGFVPSINNSIAITFGVDFLHHSSNCFNVAGLDYSCDANFLYFPVAMQWNFFVAQRWSVFGEPGLFIYHGFFDNVCPPNGLCAAYPNDTGIRPALYAGGRFHINDKITLTMRIGYPTFSVGVSWLL